MKLAFARQTVRETGVEPNFLEPIKRTQISYRRRNHPGCKSNHMIHANSEIDDDLTDDDFEMQAVSSSFCLLVLREI